ncbi:hypothetical protein [Micromonospora sp. WMMD1082]|uniref:hypothetical protein n=1 Tax=Micromonospora sp. WMMD1082 TaxID=3016104 RepID=UPI00241786CD|nr:hypothetical protein [Micromonospora sp. WMMD1082]MDG4795428.1 hypothetical protein [Micromonospora sp. WMMD1082]
MPVISKSRVFPPYLSTVSQPTTASTAGASRHRIKRSGTGETKSASSTILTKARLRDPRSPARVRIRHLRIRTFHQESWFCARAFDLAAQDGVRGVVASRWRLGKVLSPTLRLGHHFPVKPPHCLVCGSSDEAEQFTAVSFGVNDQEKAALAARAAAGWVGHPENVFWFCAEHLDLGADRQSMHWRDAIAEIRAIAQE